MLSIVFSFRNEAEVLDELVSRTRKVLDDERGKGVLSGYDLIFVNDDSTDGSEEILKRLSQGHDDIKIITMSRCFGVSPCVLAGMELASGDAVAYMDADLQDPPEVIPRMITALQAEGTDIVHTVRLSREGESATKLFITKIGYSILKIVSSIDLPINAGDFKLLSRRAVQHLVQLREKRPFIRGMVCWIGFKQATVSYHRERRFSGKSKFPVLGMKVLSNFLESAVISFSSLPLYIAGIMGILSGVLGFIVVLQTLVEKFRGHNIPGWTAIMVSVLFMGSIQLLSIGIIGLYLGNIMLEIKGRPNYIVKSLFGFKNSIGGKDSTEIRKEENNT